MNVSQTTPRVQYHFKGLNLNYRFKYKAYWNNHFRSWWHSEETWWCRIGLNRSWFSKFTFYYDGITTTAVTFLGVEFAYGYLWGAEELKL